MIFSSIPKISKHHRKIVWEVLARLLKYDLYLKPEKLRFRKAGNGIFRNDHHSWRSTHGPWKVNASKKLATTKMLKDIRGFIGFSNFYRRFIKTQCYSTSSTWPHKERCPLALGQGAASCIRHSKEAFCKETILKVYNEKLLLELKSMHLVLRQEASSHRNMRMVLATPCVSFWIYEQRKNANYEIYDRENAWLSTRLRRLASLLEGIEFEAISRSESWRKNEI